MCVTADRNSQVEPFFIEFDNTYLHGDLLPGDYTRCAPPDILFLHGGMESEDRRSFLLLRQILLNRHQLSSCAFDFIGHGSTGGELNVTTLQQRTQQAADIIDACFDSQPFSVVAVGMGAHTALRLLEAFPIRNLVLAVPEIYSQAAYPIPFGSRVGTLAPSPCNWQQSDVWPLIQAFHGQVTVIAAGNDEHVHPNIISRLHAEAVSARQRWVLEIGGSPHRIMKFANENPAVLQTMASAIASGCA